MHRRKCRRSLRHTAGREFTGQPRLRTPVFGSAVTDALQLQADLRLSVLPGDARLETVGSAYANPLKPTHLLSLHVWRNGCSRPRPKCGSNFCWRWSGLGLAFAAALIFHGFARCRQPLGHDNSGFDFASAGDAGGTGHGAILARRVAVERLRESFDYDVTRAGIVYVLVTLVIAIAALNTGNNLLYIVVAAMLAAILVSGYVSAWVLRYLELDVRLPEHIYAGRPVLGRIVLQQSAEVLAIVFGSRRLHAQEEKETDRSNGSGSRRRLHFRLTVRRSSSGCGLPDRRSAPRDGASAASGNFSGDGIFSVHSSASGVCRLIWN